MNNSNVDLLHCKEPTLILYPTPQFELNLNRTQEVKWGAHWEGRKGEQNRWRMICFVEHKSERYWKFNASGRRKGQEIFIKHGFCIIHWLLLLLPNVPNVDVGLRIKNTHKCFVLDHKYT